MKTFRRRLLSLLSHSGGVGGIPRETLTPLITYDGAGTQVDGRKGNSDRMSSSQVSNILALFRINYVLRTLMGKIAHGRSS